MVKSGVAESSKDTLLRDSLMKSSCSSFRSDQKERLTCWLWFFNTFFEFVRNRGAPSKQEVADLHLCLIKLLERGILVWCPENKLSETFGIALFEFVAFPNRRSDLTWRINTKSILKALRPSSGKTFTFEIVDSVVNLSCLLKVVSLIQLRLFMVLDDSSDVRILVAAC